MVSSVLLQPSGDVETCSLRIRPSPLVTLVPGRRPRRPEHGPAAGPARQPPFFGRLGPRDNPATAHGSTKCSILVYDYFIIYIVARDCTKLKPFFLAARRLNSFAHVKECPLPTSREDSLRKQSKTLMIASIYLNTVLNLIFGVLVSGLCAII